MLLYSVLHLLGYEHMTMDAIRNFRQLHAPTPGHPEYGETPGVETTTGPLGQGLATAVGMAMAERLMAARYGDDIVDHRTYVLASDGDLMEGISHEAISLAGHLKLSKLIVLFDDNGISIDGPVSLSESGDQIARFSAAGWTTMSVNGHDADSIEAAILKAHESDTPTMIACRTEIGYGSPAKAGTAGVHGAPLGGDEIAATRAELGWTAEPFEVPSDILDAWRISGLRSVKHRKAWEKRLDGLDAALKGGYSRAMAGDLPSGFEAVIQGIKDKAVADMPTLATRKASEEVLKIITPAVPEMIGGSADLTGSNNTKTPDTPPVTPDDFSGRYIHYGIREHGMAAAMNGMALHGGLIPYSGTFLAFSDYARPAMRLAALMGIRVIHVMTHDSIGLGEDGPTHQPVEHLAALRAIPNLNVFRPADLMETTECWQLALEAEKTPSVMTLTRQNLPALRSDATDGNLCALGAYELIAPTGEAAVSLFATGSEVSLAVEAAETLNQRGIATRVVSVPCFELFEAQTEGYRSQIIGEAPVRIGIEAAIRMGWDRIIGTDGTFIGMSSFGASAPYKELYAHFGITAEAIVAAAEAAQG
jgi:transketolase